jgi:hypothetical protein
MLDRDVKELLIDFAAIVIFAVTIVFAKNDAAHGKTSVCFKSSQSSLLGHLSLFSPLPL